MAIKIVSYTLEQVRAIPDIRNLPYYPGLQRSGNYENSRRGYGPPIGGVQHIAVTQEDHYGDDASAENVTRYGVNPGNTRASWNDCTDRDTYCPLLPPTVRPWQQGVAGMGVDMNCAGIGQEMGILGTDWSTKQNVDQYLRMSAAVWAAWFTAYGWPVKVTLNRARLFELARRGESWGLTSHAVIDPSNRSDPGVYRGRDTFPWDDLLTLIKEEQAIRAGGTPAEPGRSGDVFFEGARGDDVREWQQHLTDVGHPTDTDGVFGLDTTKQTKAFQAAVDTTVDGRVGPATRSHMEAEVTTISELAKIVQELPERITSAQVSLHPLTTKELGYEEGTTRTVGWLLDTAVRRATQAWRHSVWADRKADAILEAVKELAVEQGVTEERAAQIVDEKLSTVQATVTLDLTEGEEVPA